jgi:hypothetical protein
MMDHETWRRNLVSVIRDLADARYQQRVWVRGAGPEVDSMAETICRFFDDYDVDGFLAASNRGSFLSADQRESLAALRDALDAFLKLRNGDDPGAIRHPKWREIRALAANALCALSNGVSGHPEPLAHRS